MYLPHLSSGILQADRLVEYWLKIQNTNELTIGHGAPTKGFELGKQTLDKKFTPFDAMAFRLPTGTEIRTEVFEGKVFSLAISKLLRVCMQLLDYLESNAVARLFRK